MDFIDPSTVAAPLAFFVYCLQLHSPLFAEAGRLNLSIREAKIRLGGRIARQESPAGLYSSRGCCRDTCGKGTLGD